MAEQVLSVTAAKHQVLDTQAPLIWTWFQQRGGIAIWRSINLANPSASWTTPMTDREGQPYGRPTWQADAKPERIITDPAEVEVTVPTEVKRFHVAVRPGSQGLSLKCTDASSAKIRREVEKAGDEAWYCFDYNTQEAVIFVPGRTVPLTEFIKGIPLPQAVQEGQA